MNFERRLAKIMRMNEAMEGFLLSRKLSGLSDKTIKCYMEFLKPFAAYLGNVELAPSRVRGYLVKVMERNVSPATKATYIRHLKIFLKWVENEEGVDLGTEKIKVPKTPKKLVYVYTDADIQEIFRNITAESEWLVARNRAMVSLMLDSGLRQSEVCSLKWQDYFVSKGVLKVIGKGSKERLVPVGKISRQFIQAYRNLCPYSSDRVFVGRWGERLTSNAVKLFVNRLAAKLPFQLSSHKLRHNFATNYCVDQYERNGQIDIYQLAVIMGHEEIKTTLRYVHLARQIIASRVKVSHLDMVFTSIGEI